MSERDVKGISPEEWSRVWHVYDAAIALFDAYDAGADMELLAYSEDANDLVEKWVAACRRAKER